MNLAQRHLNYRRDGYVGKRLLGQARSLHAGQIFTLQRRGTVTSEGETVYGDLLQPGTYADALAKSDTVIHLAAATGKLTQAEYFRTNVEGTRQLVEAARGAGIGRFVHVSTIAVKFPDTSHYYYAQSKKAAEQIVRDSGLNHTILRPTLILGPSAPGLIGLTKLALAPIVPVFGGGTARLQPVHVDDVVRAIIDAANSTGGSEIIEVGGPETITMKDLLRRTREAAGGSGAPLVTLPMAPFVTLLAMLEPMLLPILPLTAGQLTSFNNDGVAESSRWLESARPGMKTINDMLRAGN
ncbi:MAG: NAD-dependent epimerase/dehydratase family protein [Bryobacteraceae bacterium]